MAGNIIISLAGRLAAGAVAERVLLVDLAAVPQLPPLAAVHPLEAGAAVTCPQRPPRA